MQTVTFEEAIERIGMGRFQKKLMLLCGLSWAADAMEILLIAFVLPIAGQEWKLSNAQKGLLGTIIFIGMLFGAFFWGRLSDKIGRKTGFVATVAIFSVFGLASAFSPNFVWLMVLRGLTGFGVGGMLPVDYSIFAEYLPASKRGRYLVYLESFWALGSIAAAGLSWLVIPLWGWRAVLAISAIPGILIFFIRRNVPESPRFLMVKGRTAEARQVLDLVAAENGIDLSGVTIESPPAPVASPTSDLLRPELRRTTLLLWVMWFFISLGYYGVFTWLPNYFKATGMALLPVYQNAFILALAQLPGYFSAAYFVEKWGRRTTLGVYLIASGLFTLLFALATSLPLLVAMGVWMSFFTLGAWGALYAYTPEAYPTSVRGTGMGTASAMSRIAGAIAPSLGAALMGGSLFIPLAIYAVSYFVAGVAAFLLPLETRQKPLQDVLNS